MACKFMIGIILLILLFVVGVTGVFWMIYYEYVNDKDKNKRPWADRSLEEVSHE